MFVSQGTESILVSRVGISYAGLRLDFRIKLELFEYEITDLDRGENV